MLSSFFFVVSLCVFTLNKTSSKKRNLTYINEHHLMIATTIKTMLWIKMSIVFLIFSFGFTIVTIMNKKKFLQYKKTDEKAITKRWTKIIHTKNIRAQKKKENHKIFHRFSMLLLLLFSYYHLLWLKIQQQTKKWKPNSLSDFYLLLIFFSFEKELSIIKKKERENRKTVENVVEIRRVFESKEL